MTAEFSEMRHWDFECLDCGSVEYILSFEKRDVSEDYFSYGVTCMGCGNYSLERVELWL